MLSPYRPANKESWDKGPSVRPEAGVEVVNVKVGVVVGDTALSSPAAPTTDPAAAAVLVTSRLAGAAQRPSSAQQATDTDSSYLARRACLC